MNFYIYLIKCLLNQKKMKQSNTVLYYARVFTSYLFVRNLIECYYTARSCCTCSEFALTLNVPVQLW